MGRALCRFPANPPPTMNTPENPFVAGDDSAQAQTILKLHGQAQLQDYITAIASAPDCWAIASAAGEVAVWQQGLIYYRTAHQIGIDCLGYSADGHFLAAGGRGGCLYIWAADELQPVPQLDGAWIDRLAWHPQEPLLAFSSGKTLHLWNAKSQQLTSLPMSNSIFDLAWHPQGIALATAGYRGAAVRLINNWETAELLAVETGAHRLSWSPDGQYLAAATLDRLLTIAQTDALEQPWVMSGFPSKIQDLAWFTGGPLLATVSGNQLVYWFYEEGQWQALPEPEGVVSLIATHPQIPLLACTDASGALTLQDVDFISLEQHPAALLECTALAWHPTGQTLLMGSASGTVAQWKLEA
jgi:WD40 repeat protein